MHRVFFWIMLVVVVVILVGRITGPSDIHDQTQPKTLAYTTDIVLHPSNWALPSHNGLQPATKPPFYNWIAAPFVWLTDGWSIVAHKSPSLLSFLVLCWMLWWLGRTIDPPGNESAGLTAPLAVIAFSTHYAWFKLAYLARPDALLTVWMILGWIAATRVVVDPPDRPVHRRFLWVFLMWFSAGLAILTKGPAGLVVPLYLFVFACAYPTIEPTEADSSRMQRCWRRLWSVVRRSGVVWGVPLMLIVPGVWLAMAWQSDPDHTYQIIIREEVVDRFLGTGAEGTKSGSWDWVRTAPNMPFAFITRYLPWSIFFIGALIDLFSKPAPGRFHGFPSRHTDPKAHIWLSAAITYTILVIIFFSCSAGKRADYIASAYIPASLVVGWSLGHLGFRLATRFPRSTAALAFLVVLSLILHDRILGYSVKYPLGESLESFAAVARPIIEQDDGDGLWPVEFYDCDPGALQTVMFRSQPDAIDTIDTVFSQTNQPFWLIVRTRSVESLIAEKQVNGWDFELMESSEPAQSNEFADPYKVELYRVSPPNHVDY